MQSIPGVLDAESGYANGTCAEDADYKTVCKGETVRAEYDPEKVSLDALLLAYFFVIDPTEEKRQGNDCGSQYQTGVYYTNVSAKETVERIAELERGRSEKFFVEVGPLKNYYPAEEYHQDYLERNPNGYCHIPKAEIELFSKLRIDPGDYQKPAALDALDTFSQRWNKKYPKIAQSWRENWPNLSTYFKYPQEVRRLIYTANAIDGFNRQLRKVTKSKSVFPTDDSLLKMLYLAMMDITKKWTGRRQDWSIIHAQLAVFFADRMPD